MLLNWTERRMEVSHSQRRCWQCAPIWGQALGGEMAKLRNLRTPFKIDEHLTNIAWKTNIAGIYGVNESPLTLIAQFFNFKFHFSSSSRPISKKQQIGSWHAILPKGWSRESHLPVIRDLPVFVSSQILIRIWWSGTMCKTNKTAPHQDHEPIGFIRVMFWLSPKKLNHDSYL